MKKSLVTIYILILIASIAYVIARLGTLDAKNELLSLQVSANEVELATLSNKTIDTLERIAVDGYCLSPEDIEYLNKTKSISDERKNAIFEADMRWSDGDLGCQQ